MSHPREELWERHLARESLTPTECKLLAEELERDPAWARERLVERAWDAELRQHLRGDDAAFVDTMRRALDLDRDGSRFLRAVHGRMARSRRRRVAWTLAAAAVLALCCGALLVVAGRRAAPEGVARLVDAAPVAGLQLLRDGAQRTPEPGGALRPGDVLVTGAVHPPLPLAVLAGEVALAAAGPARLRVCGGEPAVIELERGWLRIDTRDGARRGVHVVVRTPHGSVLSEGTVFDVLVDAGACVVAAESGRVHASAPGWQRQVTAGGMLRWRAGDQPEALRLPTIDTAVEAALGDLEQWQIDGELDVTVVSPAAARIALDRTHPDWHRARLRSARLPSLAGRVIQLQARVQAPIADGHCEFQLGVLDQHQRGSLSIYGRAPDGSEQDRTEVITRAQPVERQLQLVADAQGKTVALSGALLQGAYSPEADPTRFRIHLALRHRGGPIGPPARISDLQVRILPDLRAFLPADP